MLISRPLFVAIALACTAGSAVAQARGAEQAEAQAVPEATETERFTLHILHVNDTHSRIDAINASGSTCSEEDEAEEACFGGVARLYAAITAKRKELEEAGENVLVLDAGDQFQGSLFFTTYSGEVEIDFMNRIGFDAMVLGNHEFDLGPVPLASFVQKAKFPVIFGNVDASKDDRLGSMNRDPVVIEIGGERVGIVGAVTPDTPEISLPGPTVTFREPAEYLREAIAALQADGIEHVIALTHLGAPADFELAAEVPGIDAIIGGHTHTLFSNSAEEAAYPYPRFVEGPHGHDVPVVQAGAYSKYLGHLVLSFDSRGNVTTAHGDTVLLDASVEPDPNVLEQVRKLREPVEDLMEEVVASVAAPVDGSRETCRTGECAMGNLVADAMLERVADQGIDLAFQNGGGLRASLEAGDVTMGDVVEVLPFQNTLATFELTGENVVAALENGVSQVEEGGGRFPQVAGLRYRWNAEGEPGERIVEVLVRDGDGWAPIDPAATYGVVSNNFMRGGGDGYAIFRDAAINPYDFGPNVEAVLAAYLAERPDYEPYTDGRIQRVE